MSYEEIREKEIEGIKEYIKPALSCYLAGISQLVSMVILHFDIPDKKADLLVLEAICQLLEPKADELKMRGLLWASHACDYKYSDDGELQCGRFLPTIDFKRDSPEEIERKTHIHYEQLREEKADELK